MPPSLTKSPEKDALKEQYLLLKGEYVKLITDKLAENLFERMIPYR